MEPHCSLKAAKHLFKNKSYYHHNANDRFGLKELKSGYDYQMCSAPMQLVTPRVVMMAVRMLMMSWMMNFHVSLFIGVVIG